MKAIELMRNWGLRMHHLQHSSLGPVFAGFKKWNRAVKITATPRAPACYDSGRSSRFEWPQRRRNRDAYMGNGIHVF